MTETEKKIEVIRWACEHGYAEGLEYLTEESAMYRLVMPGGTHTGIDFTNEYFVKERWPLFLTRTIEGINRKGVAQIVQDWDIIDVFDKGSLQVNEQINIYEDGYDIDKAKLAAIIYVMEHSEEKV